MANGPSRAPGSLVRGCRPPSNATRGTRSTGALAGLGSTQSPPRPRATMAVTAKLTRRSTRLHPTRLDVEHLFGLESRHNRTDVLSNECPGRHDPRTSPRKGSSDGIHPSRTGRGPG